MATVADPTKAWTQLSPTGNPAVRAVWAANDTNVWIAGTKGSLQRYDGTNFTKFDQGTTVDFAAIWGNGPKEIFAVGSGGAVFRYDGTNWVSDGNSTVLAGYNLTGVWGDGKGGVWVLGERLRRNGAVFAERECDKASSEDEVEHRVRGDAGELGDHARCVRRYEGQMAETGFHSFRRPAAILRARGW